MPNVFHEICFVDEILTGSYPSNNSHFVRILGKLRSYNPASCVGRLADPECKTLETLVVNLKNIENISFVKDSVYQVFGEINDISDEKVLQASIVINVDGMDIQMFKKAIFLRRKFLSHFVLLQVINKMPKLKQATISSLKGVIVVENFQRYKNTLENPKETDSYKLAALKNLMQKKPSKEIIEKTGIGTTLKALENHPNKDIANEVKRLSEYWELNVEKHQPTIEVRYDNLTLHIRKTSIKLFLKELGEEEEDEKLADIVEKEIFYKCKKLISKGYRKTVRKIIFVLRHEKSEKAALKEGKISPTEFVKKYLRTS